MCEIYCSSMTRDSMDSGGVLVITVFSGSYEWIIRNMDVIVNKLVQRDERIRRDGGISL